MKTLPFFLTAYLLLLTSHSSAQITFQKTFGGTDIDIGTSVHQTTDGGYIICGVTSSFGAGDADIYLIKTNVNGDSLWTKTFGGTGLENTSSVRQTTDGGYIIAGYASSFSSTGNSDVYLIKTDVNGDLIWSKTFGEAGSDVSFSIQQTVDGGYIISGFCSVFSAGYTDIYLIKTDSNGDSLWTKAFGGPGYDAGNSVQQTTDGGYIIAGFTESFGAGNADVCLIKTDSNGNSLWTKTFGGIDDDLGWSVQQTTDGGYIIAGYTYSFGTGDRDVYLIRTDTNGNSLWTKTFGGTNYDEGNSVSQTADGGYIITGYTYNFGASGGNVYLIKTDVNGNLIWTKIFGGIDSDGGYSVQQTMDGGYIITGFSSTFGAGDNDVYLIKTDSLGNSACNQANTTTIVTTPATQVTSPVTTISSGGIIIIPTTIVEDGSTVTTLCTTVGINPMVNVQWSMVNLSPNPSPGNFTITFPDAINDGEVQIFNAYGAKVFSQNIRNTSNIKIHLKDISGGIYSVKVRDGEKQITKKLVIHRE